MNERKAAELAAIQPFASQPFTIQPFKIEAQPLDRLLQSVSNISRAVNEQAKAPLEQLITAVAELQQATTCLQQQNERLADYYHLAKAESDRYQTIEAIVRRLRQSLDPQEILDQAALALQTICQSDRALICRFEPNDSLTIAEHGSPPHHPLPESAITLAQAQWLSEQCQRQPAGIWSSHAPHSFFQNRVPLFFAEAAHVLVAPIVLQQQVLGIACVLRQHIWQAAEMLSLQQFASEVAIALQQSDRYQQSQQLNLNLEQEIRQRTAQLEVALEFESMLKRITDKVRDSLDEDQILQAAVQELTLVMQLSGCNAALYDLDRGTSTICYEFIRSIPTYQGKVAKMQNFPEIYQQLQQGQCFQFCSLLPNPERGRVSMLACPIFLDAQSLSTQTAEQSSATAETVLGDLWLIHAHDHIFTEFEIRLVQQVANQCAIAIRQARLYQAVQLQVQELEKLNRLKDDFLSTVSHELRTPITNVKMATQMLKLAPTEDKRQKYISILERELTREAELINDLLDLQRLEATSYPVQLEPIQLQTWLPEILEPFQSRAIDRQQDLHAIYTEPLPTLISDPGMLRRIVIELLNNACKYTAPGKTIEFQVQPQPSAQLQRSAAVLLLVRNQAEIAAEELPKLFNKFYRCHNADPWSQGGTGLGLALVQKLVEQLQSTISVTSVDGWTTFTVCLSHQIT